MAESVWEMVAPLHEEKTSLAYINLACFSEQFIDVFKCEALGLEVQSVEQIFSIKLLTH